MESDDVRCGDAADGARLGLLGIMKGISQGHWSAGWLKDLEVDLWRACVAGKPFEYGHGVVTQRQCVLLRLLSEEAGGWWVLDTDEGPMFLEMADWLARVVGAGRVPPTAGVTVAVEDHSLYPQWRAALKRLIEAKARLEAAPPAERELAWADFEAAQGVYFDTAHEV